MVSAAVLLAISVAIFLMGRAAESGRIRLNYTIGIRTRWTLASDEAWLAGHRAGGRDVKIAAWGAGIGSAMGVTSGLLVFTGLSETLTNTVLATFIIGACLWMVAWMISSAAAANRAAKAAQP